jgi:hypothetical protein
VLFVATIGRETLMSTFESWTVVVADVTEIRFVVVPPTTMTDGGIAIGAFPSQVSVVALMATSPSEMLHVSGPGQGVRVTDGVWLAVGVTGTVSVSGLVRDGLGDALGVVAGQRDALSTKSSAFGGRNW